MNFSNFIDYYKLLDINEDATMEEIKKAYLKKVRQYHPDNNISKTIEEKEEIEIKFKQIQQAYSILKSEDKKIPYDNFRNKYYAAKAAKKKRAEQEAKRRVWEQAQEARRKQAEEEARRKAWEQAQEASRKQTEQETKKKQDNKISSATIFNDIKQDYKDIREEEKKHSFLRRHKYLDKKFQENLGPYFDLNDNKDVMVFNFYRGTVHALKESFYQLKKLTHISKDSLPKYIIRNRRVIGTIVAAGILTSNLLGNGNNQPEPIMEPTNVTTYESYMNSRLLLMRDHTLKAGDTLSQLAEAAGISTWYLADLNGLQVNQIIRAGDKIKIPYNISKDDLDYYRTLIAVDENTTLDKIFEEYETDIDTLLLLNPDNIIVTYNPYEVYTIIGNTLYVPNFVKEQELESMKRL